VIELHPDKALDLQGKLEEWETSLPKEPSPDSFSAERKNL
jgi:hypothetical protein